MKEFKFVSDDSFQFVSKLAANPAEVFTAVGDWYDNGYAIIDESSKLFILSIEEVVDRLISGDYIIVSEENATVAH